MDRSENIRDLKEAYLQEMLSEVVSLNKELHQLRSDSMMRIGITQQIIDEHLTNGSAAFDKYVHAANAHFNARKEELRDIAKKEITKSLMDAHRELLILNPPKMGIKNTILSAILSAFVAAFVGAGFAFFFQNLIK